MKHLQISQRLLYDFLSEQVDVNTSMLDHSKKKSMSQNLKTHGTKESQED